MEQTLRIVFAGTTDFAAKHLEALLKEKLAVCAVFTQPDRPSGRGLKITETQVKKLALAYKIPVYQPESLRDESIKNIFIKLKADILITVAYSLIVPKEILNTPNLICINVHPSLLPRWRGASPIQHTILSGDSEAGVTIMKMAEKLDTGEILLQKKFTLQGNETSQDLYDSLTPLGISALVEAIHEIQKNNLISQKQDETKSCYAKKIKKEDAKINWENKASDIYRQIRAFNPTPVAYSKIDTQTVRVWKAALIDSRDRSRPVPTNARPVLADKSRLVPTGKIINFDNDGIDVATGAGIIRIQVMQFSGGKPLPVSEILKSKKDFFIKHDKFS